MVGKSRGLDSRGLKDKSRGLVYGDAIYQNTPYFERNYEKLTTVQNTLRAITKLPTAN